MLYTCCQWGIDRHMCHTQQLYREVAQKAGGSVGHQAHQTRAVHLRRYFDLCLLVNIQILSPVMVYLDLGQGQL